MKTYVLKIVYLKEMELKNLMLEDISHRININIIKINSANRFLLEIKWNISEFTSPIHE